MGFTVVPSDVDRPAKMAIFGALLAVAGSVLPWATSLNESIGGLAANGVFTLVLGLLIASISLLGIEGRVIHVAYLVVGIVVLFITLETYWNMGQLGLMVWPGIGVYVNMVAAAFLIASGIIGFWSFTVGAGAQAGA